MGLLSSDADTTYYDNLYSYTKRDSLVALAYYVALWLACYGTGHYLAATNYTVNISKLVSVVFALIPVVICRHSLSKIGICRNNLKPSLLAACAIGSAYLFLVAILPGIREHRQLLPIARIAYNVFYDEVRKRKVETVSFEEGGRRKEEGDYSHPQIYRQNSSLQQDYSPSSFLVPPSSLKMDIHQALALLKPDERTCITLQLIDGYPIDQIAKITGIAENTVKSHLRRGKEKMANYLKQNGYDR